MSYNQEKINEDLKEESTPFQKALLSELSTYILRSSQKMSEQWIQWDLAQANFKGYRVTDSEDKKMLAEGKPAKIIVPVIYAQIQTATAFLHSLFTQKDRIFEFSPSGGEDVKSVEALELDIDYQSRKTKLLYKLWLWILDINKYGVGVLKISWEEQYQLLRVGKKVENLSLMDTITSLIKLQKPSGKVSYEEELQEVLKYEGNKVTNISPYCFFPDPSVPVARFQEGGFVAHEEIVSRDFVNSNENKEFFGTKHVKEYDNMSLNLDQTQRKRWFERGFDAIDRSRGLSKIDKSSVVFTEVQFTLTPKTWSEKFDLPFGDEDKPIKFVCVIANDRKIIKFEKLNYLHGDYTYVVAEYNPDHNSFISSGMAESVRELQDTVTWLLNSHMASVKKLIKNQVLADSTKVHIEDLESGRTVIRAKGSPTSDMSKSVYQFSVTDATSGHINSIETLMRLVQLTTGVNENALGAYAPGRRSAFESKQVNAGAALRLKSQAMLVWSMGLEPAGQQILSNTRQSRKRETYNKIVGSLAETAPFETTILANPDSLAGGYDLLPYDGTLPSEKEDQAGYFLELFKMATSNPQLAQMLNLDPKKILDQIASLKGIKNMKDVGLEPLPQVQPNSQTQPDIGIETPENIAKMLSQGQIEPLPEDQNPLAAFIPPQR